MREKNKYIRPCCCRDSPVYGFTEYVYKYPKWYIPTIEKTGSTRYDFERGSIEVRYCPLCGKELPKFVRKENWNKPTCEDDEDGYCKTCNERIEGCECYMPYTAWKSELCKDNRDKEDLILSFKELLDERDNRDSCWGTYLYVNKTTRENVIQFINHLPDNFKNPEIKINNNGTVDLNFINIITLNFDKYKVKIDCEKEDLNKEFDVYYESIDEIVSIWVKANCGI